MTDNSNNSLEAAWSESKLEKYFCRELEKLGCLTFKFVSPGCAGVPDRIVILPTGVVGFVEMKTDKGELSPIQALIIERLKKQKTIVEVVRGKAEADCLIKSVELYLAEIKEMESQRVDK